MKTVRIKKTIISQMIEAAVKAAPLEACGLLGGKDNDISQFFELNNADESGEHYTMLPEEQFAAVKTMRAENLGMLGIWHSHPETPARMSDEDLRLAYTPDVIYVIVSLADSGSPDVKAYEVNDGIPEQVEIESV